MTAEQVLTVISALAAVASALWAWSSSSTAKRALALAEEDAESKRESIAAYLIDSLKWRDNDGNALVSIATMFTNRAVASTAMERVELIIHAFDPDGVNQPILVPPIQRAPENSTFSMLQTPLNLGGRQAVSGWYTFLIPKTLRGTTIDRYELSATSYSGQRIAVSVYQVKCAES